MEAVSVRRLNSSCELRGLMLQGGWTHSGSGCEASVDQFSKYINLQGRTQVKPIYNNCKIKTTNYAN